MPSALTIPAPFWSLILSERKEQLNRLSQMLARSAKPADYHEFMFTGTMGKKARVKSLLSIREILAGQEHPYIFATGSLIGEGFNLPELDTLILAMPISFKGKVIQYVGRIQRPVPGKTEVRVYDYLDRAGLTGSMYKKRLPSYKTMGFAIEGSGNDGYQISLPIPGSAS